MSRHCHLSWQGHLFDFVLTLLLPGMARLSSKSRCSHRRTLVLSSHLMPGWCVCVWDLKASLAGWACASRPRGVRDATHGKVSPVINASDKRYISSSACLVPYIPTWYVCMEPVCSTVAVRALIQSAASCAIQRNGLTAGAGRTSIDRHLALGPECWAIQSCLLLHLPSFSATPSPPSSCF